MRVISFFMLLFLGVSLAANSFEIDKNGTISVGGHSFGIVHGNKEWRWSTQADCVKADSLFPKKEGNTWILDGVLKTKFNGDALFKEVIVFSSENSISCSYDFSSEKGIDTNSLHMSVDFKDFISLNRPFKIDGSAFNFGKTFSIQKWQHSDKKVTNLEIPMPSGTLFISAPKGETLSIMLQDNRRFNSPVVTLRVIMNKTKNDGSTLFNANLKLDMRYEEFKVSTIDLSKVANSVAHGNLTKLEAGKQNFGATPFNITDSKINNGKSLLTLRGKENSVYPSQIEIVIPENSQEKYLYVLHALNGSATPNSAVGEIICEHDGGELVDRQIRKYTIKNSVDINNMNNPQPAENASIVWQVKDAKGHIGLYLGCYELTNATLQKIKFNSYNTQEWVIAGITLSDQRIQAVNQGPLIYYANHDWLALTPKEDNSIVKGSALDFSFLLDAPAGKYGYLRRSGDNFVFEKQPEKSVRFNGVNLCFNIHFMNDKYMNKMLDNIVAMGYNSIRLHHFDNLLVEPMGKNSTDLNPQRMERLDALLASCKERGLYVTLDLFTCRFSAKGEFAEYPDIKLAPGEIKGLAFINDAIMTNIETFGKNLLNHVNQYTKVAWKDDPTIITVSLINEDTIFATTSSSNPLVYKAYKEKFAQWLKTKNIQATTANRDDLWREFLMDVYKKGLLRMQNFMKDLVPRMLTTDANYWEDVPTTLLRETLDYVDNHYYWAHPIFIGPKKFTPPMQVNNESSIEYHAGVSKIFHSRLLDKPFTVTEWNYVNPNKFNIEGGFLMGAYSALQNWNGIWQFTYSHGDYRIKPEANMNSPFDIANDPLRQLSERACALFYGRGDVKSSQNLYPFILKSNNYSDASPVNSFPSLIPELGLIGRVGTIITDRNFKLPQGVRAVISEQQDILQDIPVVEGKDPKDTLQKLMKIGAIPAKSYDSETRSYTSDTGQLVLDSSKGAFSVVTPKSEGFVLPKEQTGNGKFVTINNRVNFGGFLVASIDDMDLVKSKRILLLHLTDTKNTEMTFESASGDVLLSYGKLPLLINRGEADITINSLLDGYKLYALDFTGKRIKELAMVRENGKSSFTMKTKLDEENIVAAYELVH